MQAPIIEVNPYNKFTIHMRIIIRRIRKAKMKAIVLFNDFCS
jgi:hypothetical protein